MAKGSWAATDSSAAIVAADAQREYLLIQKTNDTIVAIGIGEAAVAGNGVQLVNAGDILRLRGAAARHAIYAIGNGGEGTYQDLDIEVSAVPDNPDDYDPTITFNQSQKYGTSTAITITLAGLEDTEKRQSTAVQNDTDLFQDALVGGKIKTGSEAGEGDYIDIYVAGSADNGTTFSGDCSGTDDEYSGNSNNLELLGRISTPAATTTYEFGPWSVAAAFGGVLPKRWAIVVDNESDSTLSSTGADHGIHYQGIKRQAN